MFKNKDRIYIKDWLFFKPYDKQVLTDSYYLQLSNKVKQAILDCKSSSLLLEYLPKAEVNYFVCFITAYFEDLISETNFWNTFVGEHRLLYGTTHPFYSTNEYYEEEINQEDICFLIWYYLNSYQDDTIVFPNQQFIFDIANAIYQVFDKNWETAPANEDLKLYYTIDENENDYYVARNLIDNILFGSYLFNPDTYRKLIESEEDILLDEHDFEMDHIFGLLSENRASCTHKFHTKLLSLKGNQWAAKILGDNHKLAKSFSELSDKITGLFFYKGQDEQNIFLEHIATEKKFNLTKKSIDDYTHFNNDLKIILIGIVNWQNEWWFSGAFSPVEYNEDLILKEKNSIESIMQVAFLDEENPKIKEVLSGQFIVFKHITNGKQIVFLEKDKLNEFVNGFNNVYNEYVDSLEKKKKKLKEIPHDLIKLLISTNQKLDEEDSAFVFFNPLGGIEVGVNVNSAFPDEDNPYYNYDESTDDLMSLLSSDEFSRELVHYCIDNYKEKIPYFSNNRNTFMIENLDFLLRFWKTERYHTKPAVTIK